MAIARDHGFAGILIGEVPIILNIRRWTVIRGYRTGIVSWIVVVRSAWITIVIYWRIGSYRWTARRLSRTDWIVHNRVLGPFSPRLILTVLQRDLWLVLLWTVLESFSMMILGAAILLLNPGVRFLPGQINGILTIRYGIELMVLMAQLTFVLLVV